MCTHPKSSLFVQTPVQHAPDGESLGTVTFDSCLVSYFVFNEEAPKNANLAAMKIARFFFCKF